MILQQTLTWKGQSFKPATGGFRQMQTEMNVMFCLGLVVLHERFIRTTIGTVFVHTLYFPPMLVTSLLSCVVFYDVLVMCCVALFCVVPRPSDTSIIVLGFVTRNTVREELQSHLVYVYKLHT
jgi:hypothetical protein